MDSRTMQLIDPRVEAAPPACGEEEALAAELEATKAQLEKLKLETELASAKAEIARLGGEATGMFGAVEGKTGHPPVYHHSSSGVPYCAMTSPSRVQRRHTAFL